MASLWYCNVGHGRAEIADAVAEQMRTLAAYHCFDPFTNDPAEEDPEEFLEPGVKPHEYLGLNVRTEVRPGHELQVFYGERRGGRACTAGTCYDVLSCKGVDIRLTSLF